ESAHRTCGSAARAFQRAAARREASRQSEAPQAPGHEAGARRLRPRDGRPVSLLSFRLRYTCRPTGEENEADRSNIETVFAGRTPLAMARRQTLEACFLAALLMAGASVPAAESVALGCAKRLTRLVPST